MRPMSRSQLLTVWVALGLIALMCLVPPWQYGHLIILWKNVPPEPTEFPGGYASIFAPPKRPGESRAEKSLWSVRLDFGRLALQCLTVVAIAATVISVQRYRRRPAPPPDRGERNRT